jgi:hypothetical protein
LVDVPDGTQVKAQLDLWRNAIADIRDDGGLVRQRPIDALVNGHVEVLRTPLIFFKLDFIGQIYLNSEIACGDRLNNGADLLCRCLFGERKKFGFG